MIRLILSDMPHCSASSPCWTFLMQPTTGLWSIYQDAVTARETAASPQLCWTSPQAYYKDLTVSFVINAADLTTAMPGNQVYQIRKSNMLTTHRNSSLQRSIHSWRTHFHPQQTTVSRPLHDHRSYLIFVALLQFECLMYWLHLSVSDHVRVVINSCVQFLHALKIMRCHGVTVMRWRPFTSRCCSPGSSTLLRKAQMHVKILTAMRNMLCH